MNHLDPAVSKGAWTQSEDVKILNMVLSHGNAWSYIGSQMPHRAVMSVKNRYSTIANKLKGRSRPMTEASLIEIFYSGESSTRESSTHR